MPDTPTADATHGLSVQHADALWDAVAIPGPTAPTFTEQHERVCRAVAEILAEMAPAMPAVPVSSRPPDQTVLRDQIAEVLVTTSRAEWPYTPGTEKWNHHKHGDRPGHTYSISCALCTGDVDRLADVLAAVVPEALAVARETNRRLNYRAQQLESELAAYRRAVADWELSERRTYIPLRTLTAIAKAAGVEFDSSRYEPHYARVERLEAELRRLAAEAQPGCPACGHLTCTGGRPCGVISTESAELPEPCWCTGAGAQQSDTAGEKE